MSNNTILSVENAIVPTNYGIRIDVDPLKPNFKGLVQLTMAPNTLFGSKVVTFDEFKLHCKDLIIVNASITDSKGTAYDLKVTLDKEHDLALFRSESPLDLESKTFTVEIEYIGKITDVKTYRDKTVGLFKSNFMNDKTNSANNFVFGTHCQPFFARLIFPCIDEPSIKTTYDLSITTLERFNTISCSKIESTTGMENDRKAVVFETTTLLPTSLFGFVVGDLDKIRLDLPLGDDSPNLPITVYSPVDVNFATYTIDIVQKYLPLLQTFFDKPFPSNKLDFVLLPFLNDMVMENFTMITVQMDFLLLSPSKLAVDQIRNQAVQLVVHELVHQWMGNYISFDSWEHLAFNESFATFLAYYLISQNEDENDIWTSDNYLQNELNESMIKDSDLATSLSIHDMYQAKWKQLSEGDNFITTNDIFNPVSYHKGIATLRSLQLTTGDKLFQSTLAEVIKDDEQFHNVTIKPMDIFNKMGKLLKSENITNFVSSWTRLSGFPLLSVSTTRDEGSKTLKTKLVQHRFFSSDNLEPTFTKDEIEDVPYHINLASLLPDNTKDTKNILMTDRSLSLDYQLSLCNNESQGYYRVSYESQECYDEFCKQITLGNMTDLNLFKIFQDLSFIIGNKYFQLPMHVKGILQVLNHISALPKTKTLSSMNMWKSLSEGLSLLQTIEQAAIVHNRQATINKIVKLSSRLSEKFDDWSIESLSKISDINQLQSLSKLISLTSGTKETQELCSDLFKHIKQGPKNSVPIELVSSIYMSISYEMTSVKEWKKLFELVKTSSGVASHIMDSTVTPQSENEKILTLQNLAITNLGFVTTDELISKLLNFITTNIAAAGIENALIGVNYNANLIVNKTDNTRVRDLVWNWFKLHYTQWVKNLKTDETDRLDKITFMVLQMFVEQAKIVHKFDKFEDIKPVWDTLQKENASNVTIVEGLIK